MAGPDYAKKTVAELQEILKSRSLQSSGKKADLVARLTENDKEAEVNAEDKAPPAEATSAPPEQATTDSKAAPTQPETVTAPPTAAPESKPQLQSANEPQAAAPTTAAESAEAPSPDTTLATQTFALNLPTSIVDTEMAKRAARAARFGTATTNTTTNNTNGETGAAGTESKDDEAKRALERAQRFGTGQTAIGKLDEALAVEGERGSRKRGRGTEETSVMDDPGLIKRGGGGGGAGFRGRGGRGGGGRGDRGRRNNSRPAAAAAGSKPAGIQKSASAFSSDHDRSAAEARKKKFGATA